MVPERIEHWIEPEQRYTVVAAVPAAGNPQSYTFNNDDLALKRPFIISIHYQAGAYWIPAHVLPFLRVALIVTCSKKPGCQRSAAPAPRALDGARDSCHSDRSGGCNAADAVGEARLSISSYSLQ